MAIVTIQAPPLSDIQKKRVGERILDSLHSEGVPASSIVVLFRSEDTDIFLDGGLLFEARSRQQGVIGVSSSTVTTVTKRSPAAASKVGAPAPAEATTPPAAPSAPAAVKRRGRARGGALAPQQPKRPLPNYSEAKEKIRAMLLNHGGLSSFQAQSGLDLKGHDGASALLRRIFADLELEGMVEKQGQKRGTRYVLKGMAAAPPHQTTPVKLVKHEKHEEAQATPVTAQSEGHTEAHGAAHHGGHGGSGE